MTSHGLDPDALPVISGNYRYASGYTAAKQLLTFRPTALLLSLIHIFTMKIITLWL